MTSNLTHRARSGRTILVSLAAGCAVAAATAGTAQAAGTELVWETANVYQTPAGSNTPGDPTNRTWLGYVTGTAATGAPAGARGSAAPSNGATGPSVTTASPRGAGALVSWTFPSSGGYLDLSGGSVTSLTFGGKVTFVSPAPPAGHGFSISVENPRVSSTGTTGRFTLSASGTNTAGTYDASQPVFDLTPSGSLIYADGSQGAVFTPSIATANLAFPNNYAVGAGPDRTPNTFGSFILRLPANSGPKGDTGAKGDAGAKGDKGDRGAKGDKGDAATVRYQSATLAKAPFKGKASRSVRITARDSSKVLAIGSLRGRTLSVTLARERTKRLKGTYVVRLVGKRATAKVRIP